jgi:regulatory protein
MRATTKKLTAEQLWELALRTLDHRAYAAKELRRKLSARAESKSALDDVMKKLEEYKLLDDSRFAESFAVSRLEGQGYGAQRVLRDLRARSVGGKVAEDAVQRVYGEVEEVELAIRFLNRKYRSKDLRQFLREEKNLAAAYRRLRTGGFGTAASIKALKEYTRRADELEGMEE